MCRAIGITADRGPASEPQPSQRTPTRIAWTQDTLARIASGKEQHGAFVALTCAACHGQGGVSASALFPILDGMNAAVVYKQLDEFRSGKRLWGVMGAIASALSDQDSADVAAYFAHRPAGLAQVAGEGMPEGGRSLRQRDPAIRLVFAGDPERGIPPCAACHGPDAQKLGAPALRGQHTEYIERQLAAFAQGERQNDINQQMRVIAQGLKPEEMHAVAGYYGAAEVEHNHWAGVIAVVDDGGWPILVERMDNAAFIASVELAPGKARTAALFKKPSQALEDAVNHGRIAAVTARDFILMQGGLPIVVDGQVIGGIGASFDTPEHDVQVAQAGLAALKP